MLQVLYIDVAKVDRDVAHIVMLIHVCFKYMFQMFHLFQINVTRVLSGCSKSKSGCCIYMHVASICFKCFQVFHTYVCKFFRCFIRMFVSVFCKCFRCLFSSVSSVFFSYVATVASRCFKSRSGVAHRIRMGSG
jgi:hypothetical protein